MSQEATPAGEEPTVGGVIAEFVEGIVEALPGIVGAVVFLVIAYLVIKIVLTVLRRVLGRIYPEDEQSIVNLTAAIAGLFMWFGAALATLNIVGLSGVAASLGTAGGFVGLGVAFALKEMIADTVAGVYLLRDEDFEEGDLVETASVTGRVAGIDLRKTRIRTDDGSLVVVANRDVEKRWTNKRDRQTDENA